jgi:hypothetical protein
MIPIEIIIYWLLKIILLTSIPLSTAEILRLQNTREHAVKRFNELGIIYEELGYVQYAF